LINEVGCDNREPHAHDAHSLTNREKPIQFTQVRIGSKRLDKLLERGEGEDLVDPPAEGTVKRIKLVHRITTL